MLQRVSLQQSFPLKPCYLEEPLVVISKQKLEKFGKKEATRTALAKLNDSLSGKFQSTFVDSLVTRGGERLQVTLVSLSLSPSLSPSLPPSLSLPFHFLFFPRLTYIIVHVYFMYVYLYISKCARYNIHTTTGEAYPY